MKFKDTYGATVTGDPETGWTRGGMQIGPCSQEQAATILSGMAPDGWVAPSPPPPITTDSVSFIKRFTQQERMGLVTYDPMWNVLFSIPTINITDQTLIEEMQTAVTNNKLSQERMTQILDLTISSP